MTEEENFAYELELQQQEEENKFLQKIKDNSIDMLCNSIDTNRNIDWLIQYYLEQENLYPENHKECVKRTNQKLNKENKDGR